MREVLGRGFAVHPTHSAKLWPRSGKGGAGRWESHLFHHHTPLCFFPAVPQSTLPPVDTSKVQLSFWSCGSPGEGRNRGQSPGTPSYSLQTDMHCAHLLYIHATWLKRHEGWQELAISQGWTGSNWDCPVWYSEYMIPHDDMGFWALVRAKQVTLDVLN